jgi:esterase/lipase
MTQHAHRNPSAFFLYSTRNAAIHPTSTQRTSERIGAPDKQLITLHESGHCITVDRRWEDVAERTYDFVVGHDG